MSLTVNELTIPVFCGDIMPDGTIILGSNIDGKIYQSVDGINFSLLFDIGDPIVTWVQGILCDIRGYIFVRFSTDAGNTEYERRIYRSVDRLQTLQLNKEYGFNAPQHPVMTQDNNGILYMGTYGITTVAGQMISECWRSAYAGDPGTWELLYNDPNYCRHLHGLVVNPENNWLYYMAGESYTHPGGYGSYIMRSKDQGDTWTMIVKMGVAPNNFFPWTSKPPMGGPVFHKGKIYIGSDVYQGQNNWWRFTDLGDDTEQNYPLEWLFDTINESGTSPICLWGSSSGIYILANAFGFTWWSESGDPNTWTRTWRENEGLTMGPMFMYCRKWTPNGYTYCGGGRNSTVLGLRLGLPFTPQTYSLTVTAELDTGEPIIGVPFNL